MAGYCRAVVAVVAGPRCLPLRSTTTPGVTSVRNRGKYLTEKNTTGVRITSFRNKNTRIPGVDFIFSRCNFSGGYFFCISLDLQSLARRWAFDMWGKTRREKSKQRI